MWRAEQDVKEPTDGWDQDERDALNDLRDELDAVRAHHPHTPPIDLLRAARLDALPPEVQSAAAHRLSSDAWSRALVDGLDDVDAVITSAEDRERLLARIRKDTGRPADRAASRRWFQPAVAAAALVALAAGTWAIWPGSQQPPAPLPSKPEQTVAVTTQAPVFELPLDKPEITLSLASLTWRGEGKENRLLTDLKPALDAFRQGDYSKADAEFAALEARYPKAVEVFFYGGVARLFSNDAQRAAAALTRAAAVADDTFAPQVDWYRAVADQRAGNLPATRTRLESLCRGATARAAQACDALKKLSPPAGSPDAR
jgi:hypothetical protein